MKRVNNEIDITKTAYYRYAKDGADGRIVMGELTRLACKRFLNDLDRDDLEFRPEIIERFKQFASLFKHFKGRGAGKPFILEPWEEFFFANVLGWYWKETGIRRYTSVFLCVSRKNGKSTISALLTLWFLIADGEASPECALAANSREQASILYEYVKVWAHQIDPAGQDLKILRDGIECAANLGKVTVFASEAKTLDGYNLSYFTVDEYGGAKDDSVYQVLRSSQGQREQPMGVVISTVGYNLNSPMKKMYDMYCEILYGTKEDDASFGLIYALDDGDDYTDPKNFPKVSPNLGITVSEKYLLDQVTYAKNDASAEVGVLCKNFNLWCSSSTTWIQDSYIQKSMQTVNFDDFSEDDVVFAGIDLAATGDLTCVSFLLTKEDDDRLYFKNLYYLPESALTESSNRELYKYWSHTGQLTITSGNCTDYDYILTDIMKVYNKLNIRKLGVDRWNATQFEISATQEGLPIEPVSQAIANLNRPTKELERLIRSGKVIIDKNEINLFCFRNAKPRYDWNDNIKITKENYESKIDGVVAMIMALCTYLDTPRFTGSILAL